MLNVVAIMGRITADPELKHTRDNLAVTSFIIAVDRGYVKPGQDRQADFFTIVCWRHDAEFVCRNFRKGQLIVIDGKIQTRRFEDGNGYKRTAFEIIANNINFADSKKPEPEELKGGFMQGSYDDFEVITDEYENPFNEVIR